MFVVMDIHNTLLQPIYLPALLFTYILYWVCVYGGEGVGNTDSQSKL